MSRTCNAQERSTPVTLNGSAFSTLDVGNSFGSRAASALPTTLWTRHTPMQHVLYTSSDGGNPLFLLNKCYLCVGARMLKSKVRVLYYWSQPAVGLFDRKGFLKTTSTALFLNTWEECNKSCEDARHTHGCARWVRDPHATSRIRGCEYRLLRRW